MEFIIICIIGGLIYLIVVVPFRIILEIVRAILIHNFKKKVAPMLSTVNEQLGILESLFIPNKHVSDAEVEQFIIENESIRDSVCNLYTKKRTIFNEYLDSTNIKPYKDQTTNYEIRKRQKENNQIADAIEKLKDSLQNAIKAYKALMKNTHYFTYSEMEWLKQSLNGTEKFSEIVLPKYEEYLSEEEKELLHIYNKIESERNIHNQEFVKRELFINGNYFDTVLGNYPLDPQQREAIVKLEDNCLVIASAGSGKTSTIIGKAKYLVEKRNINPSKLLIITYTRKAANELHERMKIEGITCCTFHALAYQIIAQVTGQAPSICGADVGLNVFHKLIETNKGFVHAINTYVIHQQSLMGLEHSYTDAISYFEDRKKYGIQALFRDVDDKIIFTRSEEENRLVSMLTRLGVPFRYENPYEHNTITPEKRQYRPDFTIYYLNHQRQWQWIYLEHFGIDSSGNVPQWFGDGIQGGWKAANQKYKEGIEWKRNTHRRNGTVLIETTSADFKDGTIETKLRRQLAKYGIPIKERTDEELYELLVKRNRKVEKSVYTLISSFITLMKANGKTINGLLAELENTNGNKQLTNTIWPTVPQDTRSKVILANIIKPFYEEYERTLNRNDEIDFTDAIIQATELCKKDLWKHYEYILVDEFQDISVDRYKLLQALRNDNPKTKLFCVGDDWQSIFRFAGSDMALVYEFEKYFGYTEQCKIETTYRFHQPLINKSSNFVMKNKEQKKKSIKTPNAANDKTEFKFIKCNSDEKDCILKEVEKIVSTIPDNQSILLLGRYNYDAVSVGYKGKIDFSNNRMTVKIGMREVPFLSIHSAKGLEADNVILVNCNQGAYGFPALIEDDPILDFVLSKSEAYPFAEERRLFYVAMTRAKKCMYVLYDQNKPSSFIEEFILKFEKDSYLCPRCLDGKIIAIKNGLTISGGKYRSFVCSNRGGCCDFFETKYDDLTPPGILITENMTAQDIEKLKLDRKNRNNIVHPHNLLESRGCHNISSLPSSIIDKPKEEYYDEDLPF